ncbi:MAG TPA: aminotransferase class V-fold PLP-dependent enzyme [Anaerolineaceae bacterium]|nr:aminotransferase class V-fold PLP-dependent enzyme [Anaerolineaceae bacterium]
MEPVLETDFRSLIVGTDLMAPLLDGSQAPYVNFDNAASTPAMVPVLETVQRFLQFYSSVHRGTGFKSQLSTHAFEEARALVLRFLGANPATHTCIFGKNTTEAMNKLARRFPFSAQRNIVLVSLMEHHSNDLPWRAVAEVVHVRVTPDGYLDLVDFDAKLEQYADRLALVSISGASNVTGILNPIHRLAEKVHAAGAQIAVDCAQLAPHRAIRIGELDDPSHLDYVAFSAHKMYAPFGTGALVGRRDTFEVGDPDLRGGGEVEIVTENDVVWSEPPERDEAGSPNTVGTVALAAAIDRLEKIGMDRVAAHEADLTAYTLRRLEGMDGLRIIGPRDPDRAMDRLGVVPIYLEGINHFLAAAVLGYEFGIGVRNGCFCAHPYILHLLGVSPEEAHQVREEIMSGDRREMPGLVRISFGLYNTRAEVDRLVEALDCILRGAYKGKYRQDPMRGEFAPEGWHVDFAQYFKFI